MSRWSSDWALALWSGPSSERKAPPTTGPIGDVAAFCDAVGSGGWRCYMWISVARAKSSGPVPARAIADPAGLQSDETPAV
jgi:hypothetical protein